MLFNIRSNDQAWATAGERDKYPNLLKILSKLPKLQIHRTAQAIDSKQWLDVFILNSINNSTIHLIVLTPFKND